MLRRWMLGAALYPRIAIPDPNNHQHKEQDCRCVWLCDSHSLFVIEVELLVCVALEHMSAISVVCQCSELQLPLMSHTPAHTGSTLLR